MPFCPSLSTFCPRLAILRVHSHEMVTIDLQCYEDDDVAQLDNVGDFIFFYIYIFFQSKTQHTSAEMPHSAECHALLQSFEA